jgi:hypothetical protein
VSVNVRAVEDLEQRLEGEAVLVVRLHVEHCVHVRPWRVVKAVHDAARFADRRLQPGFDPGQALNPGVDDRERDRGELVCVDADVELIPVGPVVVGMRVAVQERRGVVPAGTVCGVPVAALAVSGVGVVRREEPVPAS